MGAMMGFSSYKTGLGLSIEITAQCDYDFVRYRSTLTYLLTYLYFGGRKLLQRGAAVYALLIYERHFKFDRMS